MQFISDPSHSKHYLPALGKRQSDQRIWEAIGSEGHLERDDVGRHHLTFERGGVSLDYVEVDGGEAYCTDVSFYFYKSFEQTPYAADLPCGIMREINPWRLDEFFGPPNQSTHLPHKDVVDLVNVLTGEIGVTQSFQESDRYHYQLSPHVLLRASFRRGKPLSLSFETTSILDGLLGYGEDGSPPKTLGNWFRRITKRPQKLGPEILPPPNFNPFAGSEFASYGVLPNNIL